MRPKRYRSVDGLVKRPIQGVVHRPTSPTPPRPVLPAKREYAIPPPSSPPKKRLPSWLETLLIVILATIAGVLAQSVVFGQLAIVAYGLVALIWRIPSRITFTLALVCMVVTIFVLGGQNNVTLAQNLATYTFLLLVAGIVSLGRELKKEGGRIYSIRERNINNW